MANLHDRLSTVSKMPRRQLDHDYNYDLWDTLPESMEEKILGKVPFSSLVPLRTVCKRWREMINSSNAFLKFSSGHGRLVYFSRGKLSILNSSKGTWETVSLQFLPLDLPRLKTMVMSTGGLVCFSSFVDWEYIVCNPLTKCFKRLQVPCREASKFDDEPYMPIPRPKSLKPFSLEVCLHVGMVVDSDTRHFKLVVGGFFPGSQKRTLVYNSHADSWKKAADIPDCVFKSGRRRILNNRHAFEKVACGKYLYFHFEHCVHAHMRVGMEWLLKYDMEEEAWSLVSIKMPPHLVAPSPCSIVHENGKLRVFMPYPPHTYVGELQSSDSPIWNVRGQSWRNVKPICGVLKEVSSKSRIDCLGEGATIFFITGSGNSVLGPPKASVRECRYDVVINEPEVISKWADCIGED